VVDPSRPRARLHGAAALKLHLTLAVGLAVCLAAGGYELYRALGGNALSWAYTFEWPLFGAFGIYLWWRLLHEEHVSPRQAKQAAAPLSEVEQAKLDAWNAYLAELHAAEGPPGPGPALPGEPEGGPPRT
jgi:hypothetical protein